MKTQDQNQKSPRTVTAAEVAHLEILRRAGWSVRLATPAEDHRGIDLVASSPAGEELVFQHKSSVGGAMSHVRHNFQAVREGRGPFIGLIVGEPGTPEEEAECLLRYGCWVGRDIPNRTDLAVQLARLRRELCG